MTQPAPVVWRPYRESLRNTLLRTGTIAVVMGLLLVGPKGQIRLLPQAILLMLWPSFGGHWVEILFLNYLRPKLPSARGIQIAARLSIWFVGGDVLLYAVKLSELAFPHYRPAQHIPWWAGGLAFIVIELIAHSAMVLRRIPNFYDGRG